MWMTVGSFVCLYYRTVDTQRHWHFVAALPSGGKNVDVRSVPYKIKRLTLIKCFISVSIKAFILHVWSKYLIVKISCMNDWKCYICAGPAVKDVNDKILIYFCHDWRHHWTCSSFCLSGSSNSSSLALLTVP